MTDGKIKIKVRRPKDEVRQFDKAFGSFRKLLSSSRRGGSRSSASYRPSRGRAVQSAPSSAQRVSVRVTYASRKTPGQWKAHGVYLERESATGKAAEASGFNSTDDAVNLGETLDAWQQAGDDNMFKIIVSPEFGDQLDIKAHVRAVIASMEDDLGTTLEWAAAVHYNTDHPHAHVAIRGLDDQGKPLRLSKDYIKTGIRARAQHHATKELGLRTPEDVARAQARQVDQQRFTDLDRSLLRQAKDTGTSLLIDFTGKIPVDDEKRAVKLQEIRRLQALTRIGLAEKTGALEWTLSKGLESSLRQIQVGGDRLKALHESRVTMSDDRLQLSFDDISKVKRLTGRVLGSGLDEGAGKPYLLVEGTDSKVHYIYQDKHIEEARSQGQLRPGNFIEYEKKFVKGPGGRSKPSVVIKDYGHADLALKDTKLLTRQALRFAATHRSLPAPSEYRGWLGQYHQKVHEAGASLVAKGVIRTTSQGAQIGRSNPQTRGR